MNKLNELAVKYGTDKKIKDGVPCHGTLYGHGYTPIYHEILKDIVVKSMMEIGVFRGNSIKMWDEYFNYNCHITGVDHSIKNANKIELEKNNIRILIGKQGDKDFLITLCDREYDFIVDDGSHKTEDHIASFCTLFESLSAGGLYCIEDLQVAEKTVEIFQSIRDGGNAHSAYIPITLTQSISKIEFYVNNKLCAIHKKR